MVPRKAERLHRRGRTSGETHHLDSAIELLTRAVKIAPTWVYPRYDRAFLWLRKEEWVKALEDYRAVDKLQPEGFFITKTAIWCLERELRGDFPKGTYISFVDLEWEELERRKQEIELMITNLPRFAPAWKDRALLTEDSNERGQFLEQALSLEPDAEIYGICILERANLLNKSGWRSEARKVLDELGRNAKTTANGKALIREMLRSWNESGEEKAEPKEQVEKS